MSYLSAPLPWLTAAANLLTRQKQISKKKIGLFVLPRTLSFTKEGKRFIAILFVIGIAAINTGNNLLYLIVAMMLSIIVISGILSESTLRGVEVCRILPRHIFAGTPVIVKWNISNKKRIFPSFSLVIDEALPNKLTAESGYILKLPARTTLAQIRPYIFHKRGLYKLEGFKTKTSFPFGFFLKGRRLDMPEDALVYPNIRPTKQIAAVKFSKSGELPEKIKGYGTHLYSLRDYTLMDDARVIHWKSTAKTTKLMAKEFEQEGNKKVKIIFYNTLTESTSLPANKEETISGLKDEFEEKVEEAASLANYFITSGFEVGFKSLTTELPCRSGKEQLYRILRELALIEPAAGSKNMPLTVVVSK
ncbi:MAG: DUF58 domain-containing protein [Deltaproteobacteria bacterium]|nr:DUF58 domain-containing protein [Deltaproteobacteria bacterium]